MATQQITGYINMTAGADLSAVKNRFVKVAADGQIDQAGLDATAEGVLQDDPAAAGRAALVAISGVTKIVAGAAVTRGGDIVSDASGRAIDKGANANVLGVALEAASGAGELIAVLLKL